MISSIFTGKSALVALLASTLTFATAIPVEVEERDIYKRAPLSMGMAASFGALAATTLTSTGATLITGDCGVWPGTSIVGFPPGVCTGTTSAGGTLAQNGQASCLTAYNAGWALVAGATALPASNLGGITLLPGTYTFPTAAATLSGTLRLDAAGDPNAQFIFLITTTFATAVSARIRLHNGAKACNVYFLNGSSATIGGAGRLNGNIISYTSIAAQNNAWNNGTWCALNGAVTLINNKLAAVSVC